MSYKIGLAKSFKRSLEKLKRFPHIKDDVKEAIEVLKERPNLGTVIPGGGGTRKLRVRNRDAKRGKSGGYRLIYLVENEPDPIIYLLLIYSKSDTSDVTRTKLEQVLQELFG